VPNDAGSGRRTGPAGLTQLDGASRQAGDDRAEVVDGEVFAVESRLDHVRQQIVARLSASFGDHHVDVRVQLIERFRIQRLAGPTPEQVPVPARPQAALACGELAVARRRADVYRGRIQRAVVGPSVCPHALVSERRKGKTTAPLLTPTSHSRLPMPPAHIWPPQTRWSAWHAWLLKRPAMPKGPGSFGAAQAHRQRPAIVRFKVFDAGHQALVAESRNAIGDGGFAAAWAEGAALATEEAIAYALRGRGERKRPPTGWESLTPTEFDVVRLVEEGLPNKDIATRLFVSPRTVQSHLRHVYNKLSLTSRVQLAQEAARH